MERKTKDWQEKEEGEKGKRKWKGKRKEKRQEKRNER